MKKIIEYAHDLFNDTITKDDIVLDMTMGNGKDTLFLASLSKHVYAFDIQPLAIEHTKKLLQENKVENVTLLLDSHEFYRKYVYQNIKGVMFNLGYLPGGDKSITTQMEITIRTIQFLLEDIQKNGKIVIVVYPGHEEGMKESLALNEFARGLDQKKYDVSVYQFLNQIHYPPYVIAIERK